MCIRDRAKVNCYQGQVRKVNAKADAGLGQRYSAKMLRPTFWPQDQAVPDTVLKTKANALALTP